MKELLKAVLPDFLLNKLRGAKKNMDEARFDRGVDTITKNLKKYGLNNNAIMKSLNKHGLNVSMMSDYCSPLPVMSDLEKNITRWFKPSRLAGIQFDLQAMKTMLSELISKYSDEYEKIPPYDENVKKEYGEGYTALDAMLLYFMIRDIKPK